MIEPSTKNTKIVEIKTKRKVKDEEKSKEASSQQDSTIVKFKIAATGSHGETEIQLNDKVTQSKEEVKKTDIQFNDKLDLLKEEVKKAKKAEIRLLGTTTKLERVILEIPRENQGGDEEVVPTAIVSLRPIQNHNNSEDMPSQQEQSKVIRVWGL